MPQNGKRARKKMNNYTQFNSNVANDLKEIDSKIKEEMESIEVDKEKLLRLRMEKLYRGMELNSGIGFNNNRRGIPY